MQTATLDASPSTPIGRLARIDMFGLFLAGFILLYGVVSLMLEHGAGMVGFAKTPYLNAGTYAYALAFAAVMLAMNRATVRVAMPHPLAVLVLLVLMVSAISGVANGNPQQYIVGWTLYFLTAVLMFQLFRHRAEPHGAVRMHTPLWPAGHLPLKGGDRQAVTTSPNSKVAVEAALVPRPISPLEGEMASRPEGDIAPTNQIGATSEETDRQAAASRAIDSLYALPFPLLVLAFTVASIFYKDNHYQYVLFEVIALYAILVRRSVIEKAIGCLIYLFIHLGSNDGFVQVEINRASILAVGTVGLIWMLWRRYLVTIVFGIFVVIGALTYALSLDDQTVDTLPRNIKEAIYLMKGDDIYNHVSSYQRVFEGQKVMEDYQTATDAEWLFGKGLGRTVDMTGAADKTPGQHALLGALEVHNIHFLHFAVFHKFGILGLALLGVFVIGLVWMFLVDLGTGRLDEVRMFFYFYLFYNLVFAMPASNFLIANPLWPAFLGMLCWLRSGARLTQRHAAALT